MEIISVSLDEGLVKELDSLRRSSGISGRSELVRLGLHKLVSERKERSALRGHVDCVLLVLHSHHSTPEISRLRHIHEGIIRTQLHQHVGGEKCMEIIVAAGDAAKVRKMAEDFEASKKVQYVKLVVP